MAPLLRCLGFVLLFIWLGAAHARDFPTRPLSLIVGFSAGSGTDIKARLLADALKDELGQAVVVMNTPGAGSTIASAKVAAAPADGYTLYFADSSHALAASIYSKLPYDSVKDFSGISLVSSTPFLIALNSRMPTSSLAGFVELARASPGKYSYGSSGVGTTQHLFAETFARQIGTRFLHVPYKSGTEALQGVLTGEVDFTFFAVPPVLQYLDSGKLKTLGVASAVRNPFAPEIPTISEAGLPGFEAATWNIVLAPRGVPPDVMKTLNGAINKVVASSHFQSKMSALGGATLPIVEPAAVDRFLSDQVGLWAGVIRAAGVQPQ